MIKDQLAPVESLGTIWEFKNLLMVFGSKLLMIDFWRLRISTYFSSDRFYGIYLKNKLLKKQLFLYLNSSLPVLFVELFGRVNLGKERSSDNMTYEAQ